MKVYRITDNGTDTQFYADSPPRIRKYKLESENPELIIVEEFEYNYKWQLIVLLNDALKTGMERHETAIRS